MELDFSAIPAEQKSDRIAAMTPADTLNSGWIPPDKRERTATVAHEQIVRTTPRFQLTGKSLFRNATKVCLWDCWKPALGKQFFGIHQITGSCVGAGGGNALFSLAAADIIKRGDPERVNIPFWLLPYGISRMLCGLHDRGDGSLGSTFADAVRKYGHFLTDESGLPPYNENDGYIWGEKAELDWSQGRKIPEKFLAIAKPHLVESTAICRSTDDVREAIQNFYPVTIASNWGGLMRPPVKGSGANACLVNRRATTWNHQMSIQGWWDHPELGELFYDLNQWGLKTHGISPCGAPPGGFWIPKSELEYIVRQDETIVFSQFTNGFPAVEEPLDFTAIP